MEVTDQRYEDVAATRGDFAWEGIRHAGDVITRRELAARRQHQTGQRPLSTTNRLRLTVLSVDALVLTVLALAAVGVRSRLEAFGDLAQDSTRTGIIVAVVMAWLGILALAGTYSEANIGAGTVEYSRLLTASAIPAGLLGIGAYLTHYEFPRGIFVLLFVGGTGSLLVARFSVRRVVHRLRRRGQLGHRTLLVGVPRHIDEIGSVLRRERWLGHHIVGAAVPRTVDLLETPGGVPVVGSTDDIVDAVRRLGVDHVLFTDGTFRSSREFRRLAWELEDLAVQMAVVPAVRDISRERVQLRPVAGLPIVHVSPPARQKACQTSKRVFDVLGSLGILLIAAPVMLFCAAWIKVADRGPVFYRQERVGRDERTFWCWKFRSMIPDADAKVGALAHLDEGNGVLFKAKGEDPRITRPGAVLRRFSLDELPQLFNVLTGDMSLVGPRPPLPREVAQYGDDVHRRLRVRPGMTGLWQVSGRSDLSWEDTVRLDIYYVDNWSLTQDLTILVRTVKAVFGGAGAY